MKALKLSMLALFLGVAGALYAASSQDCCAVKASCCTPGSACCLAGR